MIELSLSLSQGPALQAGSVSKVEMVTPMALIYKVFFPSISTFETPPTLERINPFGSIRYPTPAKPIEIGDEDWDAIESLFVALQSAMPSELRQELNNRHHTLKGDRILMRRPKD